MKKSIILVLIPLILQNCASNSNSFKKDNEIVEIRLLSEEHGVAGIFLAGKNGVIIPKNVDWSFTKDNIVIDDKNKGYVAIYNVSHYGDDFYIKDKNSNEFKLAHPIIEIKRYFNSNELASIILLAFEPSKDNTLLRLKPLRLKIDKSKVRLRRSDNDLDIIINITIKGFWIDEHKTIQSKTIADEDIELKNIVLGKEYKLSEIGNDQYISYDNKKSLNKNINTEWFAPIPISIDENNNYLTNSFGNYAVFVEVAEIDSFRKRVEQFGKKIKTLSQVVPKK